MTQQRDLNEQAKDLNEQARDLNEQAKDLNEQVEESMTTQQQWLERNATQPPLPDDLPNWIEELAKTARSGDIHEALNDSARIVPEVGKDGAAPRYSAVLVLFSDADEVEAVGASGAGSGGETDCAVRVSEAGDAGYAGENEGPTGPARSLPHNAALLLTHRAATMRNHSGQMAFPGGRREPQDRDAIATALREAWEETNLDPQSVTPLAVMQPVYIDRTNFAVVPVLAYWPAAHEIYPASPENDWVEMVALSHLTDPEHRFRVGFMQWSGPAFSIGNRLLWGFTAGIVDSIVRLAGWERPWAGEPVVDLFNALEQSSNGESLQTMKNQFRAAGPQGGAP